MNIMNNLKKVKIPDSPEEKIQILEEYNKVLNNTHTDEMQEKDFLKLKSKTAQLIIDMGLEDIEINGIVTKRTRLSTRKLKKALISLNFTELKEAFEEGKKVVISEIKDQNEQTREISPKV